MSRVDESLEIEFALGSTKLVIKAKDLLAIKLGFIGVFSFAHLVYDFLWLRIDAIPAVLTYLLSVAIFVIVFTFCWNKTFLRIRKTRE